MKAARLGLIAAFLPFAAFAQISVTEIDVSGGQGVGLLQPAQLNLPRNFLSSLEASDLAEAFPQFTSEAPPAVVDLLRFLAKTQFSPPVSDVSPSPYLLRRLDHLAQTGSIDALEAQLRQVGMASPELFERWLAAAIWLGLEVEPCQAIQNVPGSKPIDALIFCTALNGDFARAVALTEANASLGALSDGQANLILFYLDPDEYEGLPLGPASEGASAVSFLMRFDLGLPTPYLPDTLGPEVKMVNGYGPWKDRLNAAEALARSGALNGTDLFEIYQEGTPPASGQLWDRARAAQELFSLEQPDTATLQRLFTLFEEAGLAAAFAEAAASRVNAEIANQNIGKCILALAATDDAPNIASLEDEPPSPLRFILRDSSTSTGDPTALDLFETLSHLSTETPDLRLLADDMATLRKLGLSNWAELIGVQIYAKDKWCGL